MFELIWRILIILLVCFLAVKRSTNIKAKPPPSWDMVGFRQTYYEFFNTRMAEKLQPKSLIQAIAVFVVSFIMVLFNGSET